MLLLMPPALRPPYSPMEAVSVGSIPLSGAWQYEPKWDGFRCLAFKDSKDIELQSKSQKTLTAFFPEVVAALRALKPQTFVLDGELVIPVNGQLSFDHLLMRMSRSGGGSFKQAAEHPALFFVFDILVDGTDLLTGEPLSARRPRLETFAEANLDGDRGTVRLSPATMDFEVAQKWLSLADNAVGSSAMTFTPAMVPRAVQLDALSVFLKSPPDASA